MSDKFQPRLEINNSTCVTLAIFFSALANLQPKAMDRTLELSDNENNPQPPLKGTSDQELVGALQELGDGLTMTLSHEIDVLYDPLDLNSEARTRVTPHWQNDANTLITEYDLPALPQAVVDA